jgi:hypothetical protein
MRTAYRKSVENLKQNCYCDFKWIVLFWMTYGIAFYVHDANIFYKP